MSETMELEAVEIGALGLPGELVVPAHPAGLVVFAHGSGSSRLSPRNAFVAHVLQEHGLGTLLFDLLHSTEAADRRKVFDIGLLGARVAAALAWLAAAEFPGRIGAVVSRGGRPDLAGERLGRVGAPTLLIVGGLDAEVLQLNREAMRAMTCRKRLEIVPGASHLFDEPGTLDAAAHLAGAWFQTHLAAERTQ